VGRFLHFLGIFGDFPDFGPFWTQILVDFGPIFGPFLVDFGPIFDPFLVYFRPTSREIFMRKIKARLIYFGQKQIQITNHYSDF